jgi:hypothetical protein
MGPFEALARAKENPSEWHDQVMRNNAAAAQARELRAREREEKKAGGETPERPLSDLETLMKDFHEVSVEAREEKPMRGVRVPRKLPAWAQEGIEASPALRAARDRGDIKYDVQSGKWKVYGPGIPATPAKEATADHHFGPGFFEGTARRQRERMNR